MFAGQKKHLINSKGKDLCFLKSFLFFQKGRKIVIVRYYFVFIFITIIGWSVYTRLTNAETLRAVNQSFLIGLIFIMIAASVVIYQTGFLDLLIKGLQDLRQIIIPKTRSLIRADKQIAKEKALKGNSDLFPFIKMLAISIGIGSIIFSIVLLFVD